MNYFILFFILFTQISSEKGKTFFYNIRAPDTKSTEGDEFEDDTKVPNTDYCPALYTYVKGKNTPNNLESTLNYQVGTSYFPNNELDVTWVGSHLIGGIYKIKKGANERLNKNDNGELFKDKNGKTFEPNCLAIQQKSRLEYFVEKECKTTIEFEEGHGLQTLFLHELGRRSYWEISNKNLPPGFVLMFGVREAVWSNTIIRVDSTNHLYIYPKGYEFFRYVKNEPSTFVYIKMLNEKWGTENLPFIRTERPDVENKDCIYQFTGTNIQKPDVDNSDFKMIPICVNGNTKRYTQCFWTKGEFVDCTCKPVTTESKINLDTEFNFPDCRFLSSLYELSINEENTYIDINTYNTSVWKDFIVPSRMESLTINCTFDKDGEGKDWDETKIRKFSVSSDFTMPSFPFRVVGMFDLSAKMTIETNSEYLFDELHVESFEVDDLVVSKEILFSSKVNESIHSLFSDQSVFPVCGQNGHYQRWMKVVDDHGDPDPTYKNCDCRVADSTSFEEYDCDMISVDENSELDLIVVRSEYNGQDMPRYWNNIKFEGKGVRSLKGVSHTAKNCYFIRSEGGDNYIIDTNLTCEKVYVNPKSQIVIDRASNSNADLIAENIYIYYGDSNMNVSPMFASNNDSYQFFGSTDSLPTITFIVEENGDNNAVETTDATGNSVCGNFEDICFDFAASTKEYSDEISSNGVFSQSDCFEFVIIEGLLRICKKEAAILNKEIIICTAEGESFSNGFTNVHCPCKSANCRIHIRNTIKSFNYDKNGDYDFKGDIKIDGDLTLKGFEKINTLIGREGDVLDNTEQLITITFEGVNVTINQVKSSFKNYPLIIKNNVKLEIKDSSNALSFEPYAQITLDYESVILDELKMKSDASIYLTTNVESVEFKSVLIESEDYNDIPIFLTQPSDSEISFESISNVQTGCIERIMALQSTRKITSTQLYCDNQVLLFGCSQGSGITDDTCENIKKTTHVCYKKSNGYTLDMESSNIDYSCPCKKSNFIDCQIHLDSQISSYTFQSGDQRNENPSTLYITSSSFTLTLNKEESITLINEEENEKQITIKGGNNFVNYVGKEGDKLTFKYSTGESMVISSGNQGIHFNAPKTTNQENPVQGMIHLKSADNEITTELTLSKSFGCSYGIIDGSQTQGTISCLLCDDYSTLDKTCNQNPSQNCKVYLSNSECGQCNEGFYLNDKKQCVSYASNGNLAQCIVGLSATQCLLCKDDYKLSEDGSKCEQINSDTNADTNCDVYSVEKCVKCDDTYQLADGVCSKDDNNNCLIYTSDGCVYCDNEGSTSRYVVNDDKKCEDVSQTTTVVSASNALECRGGYYLSSSKCESCSDECLKCVDGDKCIQCNDDFILVNGECKSGDSLQCSTAEGGVCGSCLDRSKYYNVFNGLCEDIPNRCEGVLQDGTCVSCESNEVVDNILIGGNCISSNDYERNDHCVSREGGICRSCEYGYYLSEESGPCRKCDIDNCRKCDADKCLECESGYNLENGMCTQITENSISNCASVKGGICILCKMGYRLKDGKCAACEGEGCTACSVEGKCTKCQDETYMLKNNQCVKKVEALKSENCVYELHGLCQLCVDGYYLSDSKCVKVSDHYPHCFTLLSVNEGCEYCEKDYVNIGGVCKHYSEISHCKGAIDSYCDECDAWYALTTDRKACLSYTYGWGVGLIIIAVVLFLGIIAIILELAWFAYKKHERKIQKKRDSGIFSTKHCEVELVPFSSMPIIVTDITLIEFEEQLELNKEYAKGFYIGNESRDTIEATFSIEKDERYRIEFSPDRAVLEPGKCCFVTIFLTPFCSFNLQTPFTAKVKEGGTEIGEISLKLAVNTVETKNIDTTKLEITEMKKQCYDIVISEGTYNNEKVKIRDIGSYNCENDDDRFSYEQPIRMLEAFQNSPFIGTYIGKVMFEHKHLVVTEYSQQGTMQDLLDRKQNINVGMRNRIILDVSKGLQLLHSKSYLHYNIKPSNVLIGQLNGKGEAVAKITDFGYEYNTKKYAKNKVMVDERPIYIAPETLGGQKFGSQADVYAWAVTMFAIATLKVPYDENEFKDNWSIVKFVSLGRRLPRPDDMSEKLYEIINNSWEHCCADRYSMDEIVGGMKKLVGEN